MKAEFFQKRSKLRSTLKAGFTLPAKLAYNNLNKIKKELTWRSKALELANADGLKLHLGCGNDKFPMMLNCEYRLTPAADVVMDCTDLSRFSLYSVKSIYSHAFFEHLFKSQHEFFLKGAYQVLKTDGYMVTLGLPDFHFISKQYISAGVGIVGDVFDLHNAYRYTHGEPEHAPAWWLQQLHKSLFDRNYCVSLWKEAGFKSIAVFNYSFVGESLPLNIGVVAFKAEAKDSLYDAVKPFEAKFANLRYDLESAEVTSY